MSKQNEGWEPLTNNVKDSFKIMDFDEFTALKLEMQTLFEDVNQLRVENRELSWRIKVYEDRDLKKRQAEEYKYKQLMKLHQQEYEYNEAVIKQRIQDKDGYIEKVKRLLESAKGS